MKAILSAALVLGACGLAGADGRASSALTRERLGWRPTQKAGMIEDLDHMDWSAV